jgi:hypothetical protein
MTSTPTLTSTATYVAVDVEPIVDLDVSAGATDRGATFKGFLQLCLEASGLA